MMPGIKVSLAAAVICRSRSRVSIGCFGFAIGIPFVGLRALVMRLQNISKYITE